MGLFNAFVKLLLRSPLHGLLGNVMLITVTGRRSGRAITTPVNFVREGDDVLVTSDRRRTWWRNLRGGAPVTVRLKGSDRSGRAEVAADDRAAVAEGIVPGGGLTLLRCVEAVAREEAKCEGDEKTGVQILKRALEAPTRQIAENSATDGGVVVARMLEGKGNYGFDAGRKEYVDLVEAGIIDPTKVVRIALENAVSVASVLLLTEATMTEIPEAKNERVPEPEMAM